MTQITITFSSEVFKIKHRFTENSFTRTRKLTFPVLIAYFLNLTKGSYQQELDNFFHIVDSTNSSSQAVTKSALTQARKHLSYKAFIDLNRQSVSTYYAEHSDIKMWKGFRLCAIDGSQFRMPNEPEIIKAFGVNPGKKNQKDCTLALASVYYDVLNHISIDSSINHTHASERECAALHLQQALPNDLSLLDRGYNAFWLYCLYLTKKQFFCMRAKINQNIQFKQFTCSGKAQAIITLQPNKRSIEQCQKK